jgi:diguanylate cyclase (GGDEF)-like protein
MVAGAVLAVALLSFGFTIWWVRRKLAQPMDRLIACLESREIGAARRMAGGLSCDLERLAEAIDCAVADLADGRDRLQHLDRTFDSRVAHQTRQYEHQIRKVTHKTYLDALTGLGNRRMLEEQADAIIQGQLKCGGELSVAMFDVDNFKMLNDTMGHAAGDALLRFLGELLRSSLRDSDIGIRYAGDEFIVLMPDTHPEQAGAMAERMARLFAQQTRHMELATPPTLSAGVTSLRTSVAASGNELIRAADEALYRAKNSGKDRTYVASGVRQG